MSRPSVAVVVPTVGRPSLAAAVRSAQQQSLTPLEVVVVCDRPGALLDPAGARVVETTGGVGPAAARTCGLRATTAELVAFLDDDDTWEPDKLMLQVAAWQEEQARGREAVVSCRVRHVDEHDVTRAVVPAGSPDGQDWRSWAFRRTTVRPVGYTLGSSTLLASRELLARVPLDTGLRLHEDWDWVLRAAAEPHVSVRILPEPLVRYRDGERGPVASRPPGGADLSRRWVDSSSLGPRERGDLLLTATAGLALGERGRRGAARVARHAATSARPGAAAWVGLLVQVLLPAGLLRRVATAVGRRRG